MKNPKKKADIMLVKINQKHPYMLKIIKHSVLPLFFYFLAFCLLTYPLIIKFSTHFFGNGFDGVQNAWNLWWVNLSVLRPDLHPTIWQTNMLHWSFGTTLYAQTLNPFNGYLAVFLLGFLSLTQTYNTIVIFSFVMGGMTMYWLSHYLTKSFWGSILSGFIFTFSSYHFMHAEGHLQLVSLEWIPLFILCWYSLITKPHYLTAVGAAIVLWMVVLCDYYYFFYCVLTAILILLWYAVINKNVWFIARKKHLLPLAIFVIIALLLIGPIVVSLMVSNFIDPLLDSHNPVGYSMDLLAPLIPGANWLFNQWTKFYWSRVSGNIGESSVYLGISVYILMGYVWIIRKKLEFILEQQIYLWFIVMGFFFLMALGPDLHVAGKIIWNRAMPYSQLLHVFPFMNLSGIPVRMMVMVIFCASIFCAIGFRELFRQFPHKIVFTIALLVILLFETLPSPLPTTIINVPGYVMALRSLPNDGGVVDLVTEGQVVPLYFQTIHGKPITGGYISRRPTSLNDEDYVLTQTIKIKDYGKLWATYHIRYIVTQGTIRAQVGQPYITIKAVYDQNGVKIYRIGCVCEGN